jgi:predicted TIM-barrel fold metal-dependent hydrolase
MRAWQPRLALPLVLERRGTDEFVPPADAEPTQRAIAEVRRAGAASARRVGAELARYWSGRCGTAASLLAINREWGERYYEVPEAAALDEDAADAALGGDECVVDVQTHWVAPERAAEPAAAAILEFIRSVAPERFRELDGAASLTLVEYLRCLYLESETAVAVLTSAPGEGDDNILTNAEIAGTRALVDRLGGSGRLLHHAIVHPNIDGERESMAAIAERSRPQGWKVYTLYRGSAGTGWRLDDDVGNSFLAHCEELGVPIVCAHKGLSGLAPTGSPEDVGPAAAAFPGISLLIYHSGYEVARGDDEEGPYSEDVAHLGTNRLVCSLSRAGIEPGRNVYAELGSTWAMLVRRPREAAHVLGKLLVAVGEDRVLWGTDSVWYGAPQPLIDAFRAFQIPEALCERHGYPPLTREIKRKILGENAAQVYGIDLPAVRTRVAADDLAWVRSSLDAFRREGTPRG